MALPALLLLFSCSGATKAYAQRQRAVGRIPHVVQWNNDWARGAVFYEIFVRSFFDSNGDRNGDFNGLTSKLDYLNDGNPATTTDLGIDAIWLMPVFESASYHGYDATDYDNIESDYGTNDDFKHFLDEAHRRGIRVIVDYVMNHTSDQHPWFIDSASSPASPKRDWYVWSATDPKWTQPWGGNYPTWYPKNGAYYYAVFWSGMPDLNYRNADVKAEMFRIGRKWLQLGVDGFRLDATRYLVETGPGAGQADTPETREVLKEFSNDVRATKPDAFLVGENTVDTFTLATYFDSLPSNFNFPLATAILDSLKDGTSGRIRGVLIQMKSSYPAGAIDSPFLTNHDQIRLATQLGNDAGKLRNAAAILLTLPGAPFLYYGEEVGLQNGPGDADEQKRTPMPWTSSGGFTTSTPWFAYAPGVATNNVASETNDPNSLLSYYRNWIATRKQSHALLKGDLTLVDAPQQVLAFTRSSTDDRVLVVHNLGASAVNAASIAIDANALDTVFADSGVAASGGPGAWRFALPAHTSGIWRIR